MKLSIDISVEQQDQLLIVLFCTSLLVLFSIILFIERNACAFELSQSKDVVASAEAACAQALFQRLKAVRDPELDINIVDLGIVRNVRCDAAGRKNTTTIILTSPFCPFVKEIVADIKAAAKELFPQDDAKVVVDMKTRWKPSYMSEKAKEKFWGGAQ